MATLKHTINIWPQYKRVLQLYKGGNWEYLIQEIKKIFPEDFIMYKNELEIICAVRMIEVHGFLLPLKPEIISLPEIGSSILKLEKEQINSFIEYLNSHDGYGLNQMQEQINNIQLMTIADSSFLPDNQKQNALIELYNKQEQENSRKETKSRWSQSL